MADFGNHDRVVWRSIHGIRRVSRLQRLQPVLRDNGNIDAAFDKTFFSATPPHRTRRQLRPQPMVRTGSRQTSTSPRRRSSPPATSGYSSNSGLTSSICSSTPISRTRLRTRATPISARSRQLWEAPPQRRPEPPRVWSVAAPALSSSRCACSSERSANRWNPAPIYASIEEDRSSK